MKKIFVLLMMAVTCSIYAQSRTFHNKPITIYTSFGEVVEFEPEIMTNAANEDELFLDFGRKDSPKGSILHIDGLIEYWRVDGLHVREGNFVYIEEDCFKGLEDIRYVNLDNCYMQNCDFLKTFKCAKYIYMNFSYDRGPFFSPEAKIDLSENERLEIICVNSMWMSLEFNKIVAVPPSLKILEMAATPYNYVRDRIVTSFDYSNIADIQKENPQLKFDFGGEINKELEKQGIQIFMDREELYPMGRLCGWYSL